MASCIPKRTVYVRALWASLHRECTGVRGEGSAGREGRIEEKTKQWREVILRKGPQSIKTVTYNAITDQGRLELNNLCQLTLKETFLTGHAYIYSSYTATNMFI